MKRLMIILLFLIFLAALLPYVSVLAGLLYPPHQDPATAEGAMDAYSFLMYYEGILSFVSSKEYENASRLIEQLKYVYVPEDLRYVIERYNNLTLELTGVLDNLEKLLDKASALLYQYRLDEASQVLDEAGILVGKVNILLRDLEEATETLSGRLGVFAAPAESKVREAYNRLQTIFQRLRELVEEYLRLLTSIKDEVTEIQGEELKQTEVTLSLNTTRIFVGGFVNASGTLRSNEESLLNRTVLLFLDEEPIATAITGLDGSYHVIMKIPYRYVHTMTTKTVYTPMGDDRGFYLASLSPTVSLEVMFYETKLETTAPGEAYPGLPITVRGEVTSEDGVPLGERRVKVLSDGGLLAEAETSIQGLFEIQTTLSPQTPTGERTLTIDIEPKGVYAGTSQERTLNIVKIASEIDIRVPSFVVLPAGIYIEGRVSSAFGLLREASVTLELGEASVIVKTSENGEFNATLNMSLNPVFVGFQELRVTVEPAEPWHASVHAKASVFILNPANIGLASAAFISLGAVLYTRLSRFKPKEEGAEISRIVPLLEKPVTVALPLKPEVRFEGVKGRVLDAYAKAVKTIEWMTEISMKPHITLREFLWETQPKLDGAVDSFTDLTMLAERTLYSSYVPEMKEAVKAEGLTVRVERVLKGGAA